MINNDIQQLEVSIKQAQSDVDIGNSLDRLLSNRDFKKVIMEGYFEKEAIRLVHLKADPNMQNEGSQKAIINQMDAIGSLKQYFYLVQAKASMAQKSVESDSQTLEDLLAEVE